MTRIRPIRSLPSIPHKRWMIVGALGLAFVALNLYSRYRPIHAVAYENQDVWILVSFAEGHVVCVLLRDAVRSSLASKQFWDRLYSYHSPELTRYVRDSFASPGSNNHMIMVNQLLLLGVLAIYPLVATIRALIRHRRKLRSIPHKRWMILAALGLGLAGLNIYSRFQPMSAVILDNEDVWMLASLVEGHVVCVVLSEFWVGSSVASKESWNRECSYDFASFTQSANDSYMFAQTNSHIIIFNQLLLLAVLAIYPLVAGVCALVRHRRRVRTNHCTRCGYCLTGNVTGICSECGTPIAAATAGAGAP